MDKLNPSMVNLPLNMDMRIRDMVRRSMAMLLLHNHTDSHLLNWHTDRVLLNPKDKMLLNNTGWTPSERMDKERFLYMNSKTYRRRGISAIPTYPKSGKHDTKSREKVPYFRIS
jgi:hypothetical protein